ncbi:centromere protein R isoform 2-T2 [Glossophaga mutica]
MPVKRSLKLDDPLEPNSFGPSKITRKKNITDYSPTTGTCELSPFASPTRSKEQEHKNGPSNGKRKKLNHPSLTKRKKSTTKDNELMVLLSNVEKSSEEIVEIMQGLSSIQALEGNRKLENLIGISCGSCFLKREMQKTKELMTKVTKQKLFAKKHSELSNKAQTSHRGKESFSFALSQRMLDSLSVGTPGLSTAALSTGTACLSVWWTSHPVRVTSS